MSKVRLISKSKPVITDIPGSEELISFCARVSNKSNQHNYKTAPKLIDYCIKNKHWSILETINICFEVKTTRMVSAQILRHGHKAQELSQRYTGVSIAYPELRMRGSTNRQGSLDTLASPELHNEAVEALNAIYDTYKKLIDSGVALECARAILPMCSETTMYLNNTLRGWIHYCLVRVDKHTQKEHREIAKEIFNILRKEYPNVIKSIERK